MDNLSINSNYSNPVPSAANGTAGTAPEVSGKGFLSSIGMPKLTTILTGLALSAMIVIGLAVGIATPLGGIIAISAISATPFFLIRLGPKDQPEMPDPMQLGASTTSPGTAEKEIPAEDIPTEEEPLAEEVPEEEAKAEEGEIPTIETPQ